MSMIEHDKGVFGQDADLDETGLSDPTSRALVILQRGGADPEVLAKYLDLQRQWKADKARESFARAMAMAQAQMPTVVMDAINPQTKSPYAKMETIQRAVKPIYIRQGFTVSFSEGQAPKDGWVRVVAHVRHIDGHEETYHRDGPMDNLGPQGKPCKTELHGMQSAFSYLERRLLCSIWGVVVAGEDNDGGGMGPPITEEQAIKLDEMFEGFENPDEERERFLTHFKHESFRAVPASRYEAAVSAVKKKLGAKR